MIYNELIERGTQDFPIEFYHLDQSHPKYVMQYHWHKEIEIIRVLEGTLKINLNNTEILITNEDIVFVNSEIIHGADPQDCVYECIVFDPESVILHSSEGKSLASGLVNHTLFLFHRIRSANEELYSIANKLFDSFNESSFSRLSVISNIYALFSVIDREKLFTDNSSYSEFLRDKNIIKLKRAIEYMRKNYSSRLTLEEMSEAVGVSPKYFCVIFKSMTGMTAFEYLNTYRIEKASKLLVSTDTPITDIAYNCGFNDLSYFIKTFKKCKGITPKHFRNTRF